MQRARLRARAIIPMTLTAAPGDFKMNANNLSVTVGALNPS